MQKINVFIPEEYIKDKSVIVRPIKDLGLGTVVDRRLLSQEILNGRLDPKLITNRNLITIEGDI